MPLTGVCGIRRQRTVRRVSPSNGKTVYHQGKHTPKNCWYFNEKSKCSPNKTFSGKLFHPLTYNILEHKEKKILASASPRRKELLEQLGLTFLVFPAQGEEKQVGDTPSEIVMNLAKQKAEEIYEKMIEAKVGEQDSLVIGADTVVVKDGKVLGKPKNREDAFTMLKGLSGSIHEVYTGVSLWMREDGKKVQYSFYECTKVTMYPVTDEELNRYIDTGEPMDKAGAYGIQGKAAAFIEKIEGDYNNVVGLPIARIYQELKQLGIDVYKFS